MGDVVFFDNGDTLRERYPQAFNNLYLGVLNHKSLFGQQIVADLFSQIVFHMNMGNQSSKDKRLPLCATATYQPIKALTNEEYSEQYMVAITVNSPASTPLLLPTFQPHPPNPRIHRPAPPQCISSYNTLPTRHHSSLPLNKLPFISIKSYIYYAMYIDPEKILSQHLQPLPSQGINTLSSSPNESPNGSPTNH
ncbi:hypothetical protein DSO57_1030002 [Entomophthora muscae]|uniref:Uncharacterized protein n=1 Tax=Entomophthora muscae TaxID=34485 RepID=A0ACC2RS30_9FUNG|nr:hypothetical protein DSO57_1030002 [Entomophthora muscae]